MIMAFLACYKHIFIIVSLSNLECIILKDGIEKQCAVSAKDGNIYSYIL